MDDNGAEDVGIPKYLTDLKRQWLTSGFYFWMAGGRKSGRGGSFDMAAADHSREGSKGMPDEIHFRRSSRPSVSSSSPGKKDSQLYRSEPLVGCMVAVV